MRIRVNPLILCIGISIVLLAGKCASKETIYSLGQPPIPKDNPQTDAKIALGEKLFFDKRLSVDNSVACVDCHQPKLAFADNLPLSFGVNGGITERNAPSLLNAAYLKKVMFDGELKTLEMQVIVPIQEHTEMGCDMKELIQKLRAIPEYEQAAQSVFGRTFDPFVLTRSIAAFERTLISQNSAFDRYWLGDKKALNSSEKRGWKIFSETLYCTKCHPAPHFTTYSTQNNGLYKDYVKDQGRFRIDLADSSKGKFKIPSLRNIKLTAPYMHNGSIKTVKEVLQHYQKGGENHDNQSKIIVPFELSGTEMEDLLHFFSALTDTSYLHQNSTKSRD